MRIDKEMTRPIIEDVAHIFINYLNFLSEFVLIIGEVYICGMSKDAEVTEDPETSAGELRQNCRYSIKQPADRQGVRGGSGTSLFSPLN
jgi:hypothetical protein